MLPPAESIQIVLPIVSILFLVFSFKRPVYGAIAYFIILNAKLGEMYPTLGAIRFEFLSAVVVFVSLFFSKNGLSNAFPGSNELNKPLWILFLIGMLSVPQAVDPAFSWENGGGGYTLLKMTLFYIMVVSSVNGREDLKKILFAFALITAWIAYAPVVNFLNGVGDIQRYGKIAIGKYGAQAGHVALANTLNQGIPITYFYARSENNKILKGILYGVIVLLVLGVVFTKSRGGFVGLVVIAAGLIYFSKEKLKAFAVIALAFITLLPFAGRQYLSHIETIKGGVKYSRSTYDRYLGLLNGISMMEKRPILGVGIGCYPKARKLYFNYYFWSHNLYGQLFGELGLSSIAWFYWIYAVFRKTNMLKTMVNSDHSHNNLFYNIICGIQLSLVLRLILGNFTHGAFIWFWFLMAAFTVSIENVMIRNH